MDDIVKQADIEKNKILDNMQTVILSTLDKKNVPNSSYAPAVKDDDNNFYIYISELSKHTNNLLNNPLVSIMIIEDEHGSENIFGRKRFTMDAKAQLVTRDTNDWEDKINMMELKFGESIAYLKNLTDFHLFKITPHAGLLVHGFARAFRYQGKGLNEIVYLNEKGHSEKK